MEITGSQLFIKAMKEEGVKTIFTYPGGMIIGLLNALYDEKDLELVLPRHEQALVHEADGYARSTGKAGVCLVTSGPGATNVVTSLATANYDSVPLVCFTGQVSRNLIGNDAFQEVDIVGITRSITKRTMIVMDRKDLGRAIKEAFFVAETGRPGPVVVDLPQDVMDELGSDEYPNEVFMRSYKPNTEAHVGQIKRARTQLKRAKHPLLLIGGGVNIARAGAELTQFAEMTGIPVVSTIMGRGAIPTNHPLYIGNLGMHGCYAANKAVNECDLLFSIGTRFNDRITGKLSEFAQNAKIVHIDIDTASISRNIRVDVPIVADAKKALQQLMEYDYSGLEDYTEWIAQIKKYAEERPLGLDNILGLPADFEGKANMGNQATAGISPEDVVKTLNKKFDDCIVVTDVGQHQMWTAQYIELNEKKMFLTSGGLGTMGYGFPGSIGAAIANPGKQVICITGDGGFQMNIQEMATAVSLELPLIILVLNNGHLGMVRQMQQLFFDKRYPVTCLRYRRSCNKNCKNPEMKCPPYLPDFVKLAESYDAVGIRVWNNDELCSAFDQAAKVKKCPVIIECMIDSSLIVLPMVRSGTALKDMIMDI